ncbi:FtsX-like permease family protein [Luteibacter sp. dw_328]|uniref:ABC transporter permease n=1 Tax=Luteibacter sp. dw_328 TaxID=2719796 RepID=UPI001BD35536|nr:FtsX-like permease family protein [Luteibacter sp. dw_328]
MGNPQIQPVLAALRKHRIATIVIAWEIALACAVLCNACFLIAGRVQAMHVQSGVDEHALGTIKLEGFEPQQANDLNARVVAGLRAVPGVQSVSTVSAVPFGEPGVIAGVHLDAAGQQFGGVVDFYVAGPGAAKAMGLRPLTGRMPAPDEYMPVAQIVPNEAPIVITRVLAEHFWPGQDPLDKMLWSMDTHFRVVGVVDHLTIPQPGAGEEKDADWSILVPAMPGPQFAGKYLLQASPEDLPRVMRDARTAVLKIAPDAVLDLAQSRTVDELRETFFLNDRVMTGLLIAVIVALLGTTALGIVGLASFWVAQRRRQIGVRRALGATRGDILRYFQIENFLIVTFGIALGMILAYAINMILMSFYELPRLPFWYLPVGALVLWVLGQLAVLAPAMRAAAVPPVAAIRSL